MFMRKNSIKGKEKLNNICVDLRWETIQNINNKYTSSLKNFRINNDLK